MKEYAFDVTLLAALRVKADSEAQARRILADVFNCADCNGGRWPDGLPVLFEASIEGDADLYEVDGEPV